MLRLLAPVLAVPLMLAGSPAAAMVAPIPGPVASLAPSATSTELSLPAFWSQTFDGRDLRLGRVLARNSAYTRYAVTYRSGQFRISGVMNVPTGRGPFPVVVLAHGYIDPRVYKSGQGLAREQDFLARRGFVALHVDYRNHASSDDDPRLMERLRLGYTEDVINAALAVRSSRITALDKDRIGLLGRSMGGGIAYNVLVSQPGLFDSAVLYASVSSKAQENTRRWLANDPVVRSTIFARYGTPEQNPAFWDGMSAYTHFDRVQEPILVHHGTADRTCPVAWADDAVSRLKALGKDVTYVTYKGADHTFYGSTWTTSMNRTVTFLRRTLG